MHFAPVNIILTKLAIVFVVAGITFFLARWVIRKKNKRR